MHTLLAAPLFRATGSRLLNAAKVHQSGSALQQIIPRNHDFSTSSARSLMEVTGFTETQMTVRESVGRLCAKFPDTYWQTHDQTETDPKEFRKFMLITVVHFSNDITTRRGLGQ